MKIGLGHLVVILMVMVSDVVAQEKAAVAISFRISIFITIVLIELLIGCCWYGMLVEKDKELPPDEKVMTKKMKCFFWMMCICLDLCGGLVFFCIANAEIDRRLKRIDMGQTAYQVPV